MSLNSAKWSFGAKEISKAKDSGASIMNRNPNTLLNIFILILLIVFIIDNTVAWGGCQMRYLFEI